MNRENLIARLVARKLENKQKAGCVPCFGLVSNLPAMAPTAKTPPRPTNAKN